MSKSHSNISLTDPDDLKPTYYYIDETGRPVIIDFYEATYAEILLLVSLVRN